MHAESILNAVGKRPWQWGVALLLLVGGAVLRDVGRGELHYNNDETRHAMTGVFFRDALVDRPVRNAKSYAIRYYTQYPALGLIHWPPVFHALEGVLFAGLGVSPVVARLATFLFLVLFMVCWYGLLRRAFPEQAWPAWLLVGLTVCSPQLFLLAKFAMLEVPSLALACGAILCFEEYVRTKRRLAVYLAAGFSCLALLTKQNTVFLVVMFPAYLAIRRQWWPYRQRDVWVCLAACALILGPYYGLTLKIHGAAMAGWMKGKGLGWGSWWFYPSELPRQIGWPILLAALPGLYLAWYDRPRRPTVWLFAAWGLSCYLVFSLIGSRDRRFIIYWVPVFLYFVGETARWLDRCGRWRPGTCLLATLMAGQLVWAYRFEKPCVAGYDAAAQYVVGKAAETQPVVFFQGYLNGNFIFHVRRHDPARRVAVLRASKMLASFAVTADPVRVVRQTEGEIRALFAQHGVRYIVVESRLITDIEPYRVLHRMLARPGDFALLASFPIETNTERFANLQLHVYEYRHATDATRGDVILDMPVIEGGMLKGTLDGK